MLTDSQEMRGGAANWTKALGLPALLAIPAALVTASAVASSYLLNDSFWINLVWGKQFSALIANGELYPRWLPQSHDGLGAPVFYFYPPLAFYAMSGFVLAGVPLYWAMIATFAAASFASGWAMHAWLRPIALWPRAGAILYMLAPYHLMDFYKRGALAEFVAFAWLPLIALGMRRAAADGRFGLLAASYAALILTHLPSSVLVTILFVIPYALMLLKESRQHFVPLAAGGVTGLMLAGIYLVPMLALQRFTSLDMTVNGFWQQGATWSIYNVGGWPQPVGLFVLILAASYVLAAVILMAAERSRWALAALALTIVALGFVPGIWSLPLLDRVQFPWRSLMIVEFLLATAIASARLARPVVMLAPAAMLIVAALIAIPVPGHARQTLDQFLARTPEVVEFLPPGVAARHEQYATLPLRIARALRGVNHADAAFDFPTIRVECREGRARRVDALRLTVWDSRHCFARRRYSFAEQGGLALSLTGLALLAFAMLRRRGSRI